MNSTCVAMELMPFDLAKSILVDAAETLSTESVRLSDALGRVAAESIVAKEDLVPYPRSAMDGYALRSIDTQSASPATPVELPLTGKVFTGDGQSTLVTGTALGITTGAPIPFGADAVVPLEQVSALDGKIFVGQPVCVGDCIFPPAEDVHCGETLLRRRSVIRPANMAMLAFAGHSALCVYRRPNVSLLCTGSELVDVSDTPACGQVRNSNAYSLRALLSECGATTRYCGAVTDNINALSAALEEARRGSDVLVTTGGASAGERDLIKSTLEEMGAEFEFRKVAIRPGKPFAFGRWQGLPVCVLPGNPAAAFVCYHEFVRPLVLRMAGRETFELPVLTATLAGHAKSKPGSRYILFGNLSITRFGFVVEPLTNQCSALVRNPATANALILLPEGPTQYSSGDQVSVQVLNWDDVALGSHESLD
jgi:molybdopterin molybdotransferase